MRTREPAGGTRTGTRARSGSRSTALALAAVAVVVAAGLAGCASDAADTPAAAEATASTSTAASPATAPASADAVASPGCGTGPAVAPGRTDEVLDESGVARSYRRLVPPAYADDTPAPLVVDLHGLTMTSALEAALTGMEDLGADEGFVVVTPQGLGDIPFWNFISAGVAGDDVAFLGDLVERVGEDLCIDTSRVYATGISNGGLMSSALACRLPDVFAAVAPVSGVTFLPGCEDGPPVSYQAVYGTADTVLPYDGGLGSRLQGFLSSNPLDASTATADEQRDSIASIVFAPVDDTLARWAERNGCDAEPDEERISAEVVRRSWPGCDGSAEVVLYVVEGGGHTWPGTPLLTDRGSEADTAGGGLASVGGQTTDDISATALAWEFFQRHQLGP